MSLSATLSNALSGLTASSRQADVVSSNIANAMTEGYVTRRLTLSPRLIGNDGAGVQVAGVVRQEDAILIAQRRVADANLGASQIVSNYLGRLEQMIGTPDSIGSLSQRVADFEGKLVTAANSPWNTTTLEGAVSAATDLAEALNALSSGIQNERQRADTAIGTIVATLNSSLSELEELNTRILTTRASGGEIASLQDAQAQLVDGIAGYIPLQTRRDDQGRMQIWSEDGHVLLSHRAAVLGFSAAPGMDADLSLANDTLSGLTLNGRALRLEGSNPAFDGGELSAQFMLRDTLAPQAQARADAIARDLAGRFDDPGLDLTRATGDPGLFTDAGNLVDPLNEVGLAGRIAVNSAVITDEGGEVWRLRDGIGASVQGPSGDNSLIRAQIEALSARIATASGGFSSTARSFSDLISDNLSSTGLARHNADTEFARTSSRQSALSAAEFAGGVDTDDELQRLLKIEQMYAANARVVSVAEELMDELMRIGR